MDQPPKRKSGSLFKRAFWNQYNFILLGSTALFSLATMSWLPAVVGLGVEALWLVLGTDSGFFRRWVEKADSKEAKMALLREAQAALAGLDEVYEDRFRQLERTAAEVEELAKTNPGLETLMVKDEMAKLGQLLHNFLRMAVRHQQLTQYLGDNPSAGIERDIAQGRRALKEESDPRVQSSLKQALDLALKRQRQHERIEGAWKALSVQMVTLEKAFGYLKSHILGIGTGEELAAELDGLVTGVSSVAELDAETDRLMAEMGASTVPAAARAARAQVKAGS